MVTQPMEQCLLMEVRLMKSGIRIMKETHQLNSKSLQGQYLKILS